jgi:hypothetical protein
MNRTENHANYVTCDLPEGGTITFRVGQPTDWNTAINRHNRIDEFGKRFRIRYMRRSYTPRFCEVRATDKHGRGLGSERHAQAVNVPFALVTAL